MEVWNFNWLCKHMKKISYQDFISTIVIRNRITVWKHGCIADIFSWTWNLWAGRTENTSKQQKMVAFVRNCSVKITLSQFLATFCCYDYNANDCYRSKRLSQMLLVCYSFLNSRNISVNNSEKRLVTTTPPSWKSCRGCTEKGSVTDLWWVLSTMEMR